jgi:hypothetical protein
MAWTIMRRSSFVLDMNGIILPPGARESSWTASRKPRKFAGATLTRAGESSLLARMSDIDRRRVSGVRLLESLGYVFRAGAWQGPARGVNLTAEADLMHGMLVTRADALEGFTENSPEEAEYAAIAELVETYEAKRWPEGREPKGKG